MLFVNILTIIVLGIIFFEDIRYRGVSWYYFVILAFLFLWQFLKEGGQLQFVFYNFSFIVFQVAFLAAYFGFKNNNLKSIGSHIGWGDIILWGLLTLVFSPINFIVFFILSSTASLLLFIAFNKFLRKTIPLAGFQSLFLLILSCGKIFGARYDFFTDYWLTNLLNGY